MPLLARVFQVGEVVVGAEVMDDLVVDHRIINTGLDRGHVADVVLGCYSIDW